MRKLAALFFFVFFLASGTARADAPEPPKKWAPDDGLAKLGMSVFAAGYLPAAAAGLPSIGGAGARFLWVVGTLGLGPWASCSDSDTGTKDAHYHQKSYLCDGTHGAFQLALPIAGPVLFAEGHPRDSVLNPKGDPLSGSAKGVLYASSITQAAGATLMIGSVAMGREEGAPKGRSLLRTGGVLFGTAYGTTFLVDVASLAGGFVRGMNAVLSPRTCGDFGRRQHSVDPICGTAWGGIQLAVPIAGPFLFAANHPKDEVLNPNGAKLTAASQVMLYTSGAAQALGATAMLVGLAEGGGAKSVEKEKEEREGATVHVRPLFAPGTAGLTASIDGW